MITKHNKKKERNRVKANRPKDIRSMILFHESGIAIYNLTIDDLLFQTKEIQKLIVKSSLSKDDLLTNDLVLNTRY